MIIEPEALCRLLFVPPGTPVEVESGGMYPSLEDRASLVADGQPRTVVIRSNMDEELAQNHAAILDLLTQVRFPPVPRVYVVERTLTIEEDVPAISALSLQLPAPALAAAVDAIALLHELRVVEGLRQDESPESVIDDDWQLFRLGFTSDEREAAAPHLAKAKSLLVEHAPFGFTHGDLTAANVLASADRAWLVDFSAGGFGCQLFDLAAFLVTAGESAEAREQLARRYVQQRRLPEHVAGLVELAEVLWGVTWLKGLSRRLVLAYEDETVSAAFSLMASRIDRAMSEGWQAHPVAADIRLALWPNRRRADA